MRGQFLLALRYLTRRKQRLVLTTLAIIFGVAVLFGMNAMLPGVMTAFRHTMVTAAGKVDLSVSSLSNNPFDQSALEQLKDIPGISVSTGILQRNVLLPASLGGTANPLTGSAAIVLNGIDVESATRVRKYQVDSGRFLETSDEKGVVLGYSLAKRMGLEPGDGLTLPSSQGSVDLTVVGILSQFTSSTVDEAYVTLPTAQQILLLPGRITNIDLLLDSGADKALVSRAILAKLGSDFKMGAVEVGNELEDMLALGQNVMWLFGIMALITAGFIIFNTFRTIVAERRRDLGMLRAVGASKKTVMGIILTESFLQGVIGTALGLVLGYLLALGLLKSLAPMVQSYMRITLGMPVITPTNLVASILLGIGFTVGSAYLPARSAMRVTPLEALRPETLAVEHKQRTRRALIGLVLVLVSIPALLLGELKLASLAMLAFLVGLVMLLPVVVKPVADTFGRLVSLIYAREGSLARGNLKRQPGRAAITASAMMMGLAVTIAMIGMVTSVFDGFLKYLDKSLGSDYLMMPSSLVLGGGNLGSDPKFAASIAAVDGIRGVTSLRLAASQADGASLQVIGIDPQEYPLIAGLEFSKGDETSAYQALADERAIVVNGIFSSANSVKVGDVLNLQTAEGVKAYRVAGIAMDYLNAKLATGYISQANMETDFHVTSDVLIMADREPGADTAQVDADLKDVAAQFPAFTLIDSAGFKAEQENVFNSAKSMMYALVLMLAIPGLIAMANTLGINVIERKREIGTLRAVGSTRRQVKRMFFAESLLLSALGTLVGILVGLFLSYYMLKALILSGFKLNFFFPGLGILVAIVVGLAFGILAAMIPARQAANTVIVEALRYE